MREPTDPVGQPNKPLVQIESVLELPWLAPDAGSLAQLASSCSTDTWNSVRQDPAMVLMLLRPPGKSWDPSRPLASTESPDWYARLHHHLNQPPSGLLDWSNPQTKQILPIARASAEVCHALSEKYQISAPNRAWIAGLLAPLGWLAIGSIAPDQLALTLRPLAAGETWNDRQMEHWGMRHGSLVRRLSRSWQLPDWLSVILGSSGMQEREIELLGGEPALWHLLHVSLDLVRETVKDLGLVHPEDGLISLNRLGWTPATLDISWIRDLCQQSIARGETPWNNPYQQGLLKPLLNLAAENRRLQDTPRQRRLENELDQLHEALEAQHQNNLRQLHRDKLEAMAEFAAGAGHEINNPLAVVSGQAQYLLGHEEEWFTEEGQPQVRKALQTVIAQTRRVHGILRDVMHYARPSAPSFLWTDLPSLLAAVASSQQELASQKRIQLDLRIGLESLEVFIDVEQVRQALTCLLVNAIEAAPADGWARITLNHPEPEAPIDVLVEDSGPGPNPAQRDHIFEPFFSGRNAGRGRGLGLSIAWRLTRLQGGDVWLARSEPGQPTRFVLRLPFRNQNLLPMRKVA